MKRLDNFFHAFQCVWLVNNLVHSICGQLCARRILKLIGICLYFSMRMGCSCAFLIFMLNCFETDVAYEFRQFIDFFADFELCSVLTVTEIGRKTTPKWHNSIIYAFFHYHIKRFLVCQVCRNCAAKFWMMNYVTISSIQCHASELA